MFIPRGEAKNSSNLLDHIFTHLSKTLGNYMENYYIFSGRWLRPWTWQQFINNKIQDTLEPFIRPK